VARRTLALLLALLALAPGCGGDDEPDAAPPLPDLTVPQTDTSTAPDTETETAPAETAPPATDGGAGAPAPETTPDSPTNDTPPPAGSPAERFEDFCNENPGACG
jgi:hypothetical protein